MTRNLLIEVRDALQGLANAAGDVPEWNEGGHLYELSRKVRRTLPTRPQASLEQVAKAADLYGTDYIEIDADAAVSVCPDGVWVQAWVWLGNEGKENQA